MNTVGANQQIAGGVRSIREAQGNTVGALLEAGAAMARLDAIWQGVPHGLQQHGVKVASMHHPVGRSKTLYRGLAQIKGLPALTGGAETDFLASRCTNNPAHRGLQPKRD